jgi:hypothetical protein
MIHTKSATPLEKVMVEQSATGGCHVWMRKNITESVETFDGVETTVYEADELYYYSAEVVTAAEVEADFSSLWTLHQDDGLTDTERAQARIAELESALVELADLIGGAE